MFDVLIIGSGAIGSILARELSRYELNVALIDKENDVGNVTSMANSAIIHSGYDPLPGSLKAKFNVLGNPMFDKLAEELDFNFARIGSITVVTEDSQWPMVNELVDRAEKNGVKVEVLSKEELKKIEPNISNDVKGGLFAPTAGIIDPFNYVAHAVENAVDNGVTLFLDEEVKDIKKIDGGYKVITSKGIKESKMVVNAAGFYSDKIAKMVEDIDWSITPKKGEYFVLDHFAYGFVNHTIFPLPSEKGKGILVSPTTSGNYIVGPSSETSSLDDFSCDKLTLDNIKKSATEMVPNIPFNQTIRTFAGLRATSSRHDFIIEESKTNKGFINLGGIESPGFVSSPAIAKYVIEELISKHFILKEKKDFDPYVRKYPTFYKSSKKEWNELIKQNPDFGVLVCNCERISLGQIKDCLSRSVPPRTLKAMKKRCRAGMGKCQGGFCSSTVLEEISKKFGISKLDVLYDKDGSNILKEDTKEAK